MSSSSFWSSLRWRLGGSDSVAARINDLIQKQIMANSEAQDVTVDEILNPIVTIPSKMVMRDHLHQTRLRSIAISQNTLYPIDPDLEKLRCWIKNEHGGRYLTDHSFMNNKVQLNGTDQTKLVFANDDDGISGSPIVNRLIDDQYMRVEDSANIRIKEITATEEGFSCFIRLYIERAVNETLFGKPNVLFSKIDTEQVDYAYAGYLEDGGAIVFLVRIAGIEYFLRAPAASIIWTNINLPDYSDIDYSAADYNTLSSIPPIPNPAPYVDLGFTFKFSDKRMQIIRSEAVDGPGIVIADSNTVVSGTGNTKHDTNLKGFWRMLEGGPIGVSPVNTIYDSSPNALNGLATNPVWLDVDNNLEFTGNNAYVSIATNTGGKLINNFTTAFTFAAWAKITAIQDGYAGLVDNINGRADGNKILIRNNGANTEILWRGHNGTDPVDTLATKNNINVVNDGLWHFYLVTYDGAEVRIYLDGILVFAEAQTYTLGSGTTAMTLGWGSTSAGSYHLTGWMQDAMLWNTNLTAQEVTDLYNQSRPLSYFPKWLADPPTEPPPPGPVTNPFVSVYNVPLPAVAERDMVRLHAITAASLTEHYNVGQGTQQTGSDVTEDGSFYSNDPPYDPGGTGEVLSGYNQSPNSISSWLLLHSSQFGGEKIQSTSVDLIGKFVKKVSAYMCDYNPNVAQATGNIVAKIKKAAGGEIVSTPVAATDLANNQGGTDPDLFTVHDFVFPASPVYNLVANDKIQFEFDQGGTGGGGGETITAYAQLNHGIDDYEVLAGGNRVGQHIRTGSPLIGKIVTKIVCQLCDIGPSGSTGPVQMHIKSAGGTTYSSSDTKQASELANNVNKDPDPGAPVTTVTFTFATNTHALALNDILEWSYGGGSGTGIGIGIAIDNPESATDIGHFVLGGWFGTSDGYDATMDVYEGGSGGGGGGGGGTPVKVYDCDPASNDTVGNLTLNGHWSAREVIKSTSAPFNGKIITQISVYLGRSSAPVASGSQVVVGLAFPDLADIQFGVINTSTLPVATDVNGLQLFNFTKSNNTHVMRVNDYFFVALTGLTDPGQTVYVRMSTSSKVTGCNLFAFGTAPSQDFPNNDIVGELYATDPGGGGTGNMQVAIGRSTSSVESGAVQYDGQWANPGSTTDRTSQDLYMQVFVAATGSPNHAYHRLNDDSGQNRFAAIFINATSAALFGKKPTRITARLRKQGSPTGTIFCRIKKGAGGADITFGLNGAPGAGLNVSTLTTPNNPADLYNFENDDNGQTDGYALAQGDRIIFEYSSTSSDATTNYVEIARTHTVSTIAGVNMQLSTLGTTWTNPNSSFDDVIGHVYVGGYTIPNINPYHTLGFGNSRVTQKVTSTQVAAGNIHNRKITQVKPWLARIGSPIGLINVVIRNSADVVVASINQMQAGDVSDVDYVQYPFTNVNNTYPMALNDRVSIEYSGGDANNHIRINTNLLNTYPYGVLETYTGSTYTTRTNHDLAAFMYSGGGATDPLARTRVGEQVVTTASALKLKKISRIKVWMKRTVLPTGNVTFVIRGGTNDAIKATIGTKPVIDIDPNDATEYTITSSPIATYALQVGDYVSVEYNAGDDFNFVEVMTTKTTDGFDGILTALSKHNGNNWVSSNAIDLVGTMYEGGDTFTPSQEDVLIPDPAYTKDLTVLAGGTPWSYIDHTDTSLTHAPSQWFVNAVMPDFRFYRKILTVDELTNIFTNRLDRGDIPYGQVALIGYFALAET